MIKILKLSTILIAGVLSVNSCSNTTLPDQVDTTGTSGPEKGSLVIVGGAMSDSTISLKFIELAGGFDAPIVIVPTASGAEEFDSERITRMFTKLGATNVSVVHTYDPVIADTDSFVEPIKEASGVWFNGGRQWRLVDAYGGTKAEEAFAEVLNRGGVIGGSSAGATIQGSFLARGDTKANTIMMGDHIRGFGYLKNSAIDQHLLVRNRQHDLIEVIREFPSLLGIGLDENTGIVVQGDEFEVIGASFVAIYDYNLWDENPYSETKLANRGKFFLLRSGDRYNVNSREVVRWRGGESRNIFAAEIEPSPAK
jgi:cyanophycinase